MGKYRQNRVAQRENESDALAGSEVCREARQSAVKCNRGREAKSRREQQQRQKMVREQLAATERVLRTDECAARSYARAACQRYAASQSPLRVVISAYMRQGADRGFDTPWNGDSVLRVVMPQRTRSLRSA